MPDLDAARAELAGRGVDVGDVQDVGGAVRYAGLSDPDGNTLTLQELAWRTGDSCEARLRLGPRRAGCSAIMELLHATDARLSVVAVRRLHDRRGTASARRVWQEVVIFTAVRACVIATSAQPTSYVSRKW